MYAHFLKKYLRLGPSTLLFFLLPFLFPRFFASRGISEREDSRKRRKSIIYIGKRKVCIVSFSLGVNRG